MNSFHLIDKDVFDIHWDPVFVSYQDSENKRVSMATKDQIQFYSKSMYLTI